MPKLTGPGLENYILGLVDHDKLAQIEAGDKQKQEVNVRKNNANSKWVKNTATSGRNNAWYKAMGLFTFLNYTKKEPVVFFRVFSGQFAGGKYIKNADQTGSAAFQASPGAWYLENKDKNYTCLLSEFTEAVNDLYASQMVPEEFVELARQFNAVAALPENQLTFGREVWKDVYNELYGAIKGIIDIDDKEVMDIMLKALDKRMKKAINTSKYLKKINKARKVIDLATGEQIVNFVIGTAKKTAGKNFDNIMRKHTGRTIAEHMNLAKVKAEKTLERNISGKIAGSVPRSLIKKAAKYAAVAI